MRLDHSDRPSSTKIVGHNSSWANVVKEGSRHFRNVSDGNNHRHFEKVENKK